MRIGYESMYETIRAAMPNPRMDFCRDIMNRMLPPAMEENGSPSVSAKLLGERCQNDPDVRCASAFVDTDGEFGGQGDGTRYGNDDRFASFSTYGSVVDITAVADLAA